MPTVSASILGNVQRITCFGTIEDLIDICASRSPDTKFKASGSHWGLSETALSDDEAIETNWSGSDVVPRHPGFDLDLDNLYSEPLYHHLVSNSPERAEALIFDPCLQQRISGPFFVHPKSGTRVYEVYSLLDQVGAPPRTFASRLNNESSRTPAAGAYDGPWAFATLNNTFMPATLQHISDHAPMDAHLIQGGATLRVWAPIAHRIPACAKGLEGTVWHTCKTC